MSNFIIRPPPQKIKMEGEQMTQREEIKKLFDSMNEEERKRSLRFMSALLSDDTNRATWVKQVENTTGDARKGGASPC